MLVPMNPRMLKTRCYFAEEIVVENGKWLDFVDHTPSHY